MRNYLTALGLLLSIGLSAQSHQIKKHSGETLDVNFIKFENNILHYSPDGSKQEVRISKHAVAYVHDNQNATKDYISNKVTITSKEDFDKVAIIDSDESLGLNDQKSIEIYQGVHKGGTTHFTNPAIVRRLKYKSAELGYPFIRIVSKKDGKYSAIAYNY